MRAGRNARFTPLLLRYAGEASLSTWLKRVARNRLVSRMRSLEERLRVFPEPEDLDSGLESKEENRTRSGCLVDAVSSDSPIELKNHPLLSAMAAALVEVDGALRDDLLMLKLHYLHGVAKNRLALAWGIEPSTVGRRIDRVILEIRRRAKAHLPASARAMCYGIEDFLEAGCEAVLASPSDTIQAINAKGAES